VIPRELTHVRAIAIDVDSPRSEEARRSQAHFVAAEVHAEIATELAVYVRGERWIRRYDDLPLQPATVSPWKAGGVYLITGGLGGIGSTIARHIAEQAPSSTLVLVGRTDLGAESSWADA